MRNPREGKTRQVIKNQLSDTSKRRSRDMAPSICLKPVTATRHFRMSHPWRSAELFFAEKNHSALQARKSLLFWKESFMLVRGRGIGIGAGHIDILGDRGVREDSPQRARRGRAATKVWHGHPGRDRFTGWKPVPRESSRAAKKLANSSTEPTEKNAGWRRHAMFGVCDLPKGPFLPTALRREYTLLRHALLPPRLQSWGTPIHHHQHLSASPNFSSPIAFGLSRGLARCGRN